MKLHGDLLKEGSKDASWIKIAAVLAALLILSVVLYIYIYVSSTAGSIEKPVSIEIKPGASFYSVANGLEEKGVIGSVRQFYLYAKYKGALTSIKRGEYLFETAMTPGEILGKLVKGEVVKYRATIPEGYNLYQVAEILEETGIISRDEFLDSAFDAELMKKFGIKGVNFEGYLYPETYFFVKGMKADEIIKQMVESFKKVFSDELEERGKELGFSREDIVNLASVIEKETGDSSERPIISAVFQNRLKQGMRLQSDPTVIYGMIGRFDGDLKKKDLRKKTPYNTYRINGLPLGPIANPGIEALRAVVYPAEADYIYFVSKNNGSHVFAKTLKEHNRNVWKYQKRRKR